MRKPSKGIVADRIQAVMGKIKRGEIRLLQSSEGRVACSGQLGVAQIQIPNACVR